MEENRAQLAIHLAAMMDISMDDHHLPGQHQSLPVSIPGAKDPDGEEFEFSAGMPGDGTSRNSR